MLLLGMSTRGESAIVMISSPQRQARRRAPKAPSPPPPRRSWLPVVLTLFRQRLLAWNFIPALIVLKLHSRSLFQVPHNYFTHCKVRQHREPS